jgi:methionyl-tRNA synthetase
VPEFRETNHLFLDLPQFADRLRTWIEGQRDWRPNVRNFSLRLVDELRPRPITRDLDWGVRIPVPGYDEDDNKRIYVWFDAVIGYLSASIEWAALRGEPDAWRDWWQNPEAEHYYFQGKDNIVFHTVIWPAMLLGYGQGGAYGAGRAPLELPDNVVASEFLTMEGKQFSTSRGYSIYLHDFLERYDPDALRFFLVAAGPETQDTDFTWAEFVRRNNDELLANWGNLVNRTLINAYRNFGAVPDPGELAERDRDLLASVAAGFSEVGSLIERCRFRAALGEALRLSSQVNQYISDEAPWALVGSDRTRAATVLYVALRAVDGLKVLFAPFLPHSSQALHELLGYEGWLAGPLEFREVAEEDGRTHAVLTGDYAAWIGHWQPSELPPGQRLREPRPLFRKLDPSVVDDELGRV